MSPAMQATAPFKLAFLSHMLVGLRRCGEMGVPERKRAIQQAADMAMAAARGGGARWSRALLAGCSCRQPQKGKASTTPARRAASSSKKILRRSLRARVGGRPRRANSASLLARRMVRKRTQVLRGLVPGGESMDGFSLLDETLDYMVSLRAQVDLMNRLTDALVKDSR